MRKVLVTLALAALLPAGCATGFRVGGNNYGAGIGGYVGPVPEALRHETSYASPPPPVAAIDVP
ncbi:hypothetical protein [Gemmata sp.]|uniref:hypothetical protein n=1 Tax=Gemmata sp. TaxID=1914242 RepID=UPI003F728083